MTRKMIRIPILLCAISSVASLADAAQFQNLGFEEYTGGPSLPHWQLVMWSGAGELLYKGEGPGVEYPFVGLHLGSGPVIAVSSNSEFLKINLEGDNGLYLTTYADGDFPTEAQAQAYVQSIPLGGVGQKAEVPSWARSFWIATPVDVTLPQITFSGHHLQLGLPTFAQSQAVFQLAGVAMPVGLGGPPFPLPFPLPGPWNPPTWKHWAGNIESIAGLTRELILKPKAPGYSGPWPTANGPIYYTGYPYEIVDMIMFSPETWDGPAVGVAEPSALGMIVAAAALAVGRRRLSLRG